MNEEINKNAELNDDELEQAAGGSFDWYAQNPQDCPNCHTKMSFGTHYEYYVYFCETCGHRIVLEP